MKIRRARPDTAADNATLAHLQHVCLPSDTPCDVSAGFWWLALDGAQPVGFAGLKPSRGWAKCGYLCRSGVAPSHRGLGLQKRLIRVREAQARRMGWEWLITDTTDNPASANSLISCGFRIYDPQERWGNSRALYWRKKVAA